VGSIECRGVPSVCRRIAALLAVACLGVAAPVTPALAQGAGDQQYQDPFGDSGSDSGSSGSGSSGTTTQPQDENLQPLSPAPQNAGSGSSAGSSGSAGTSAGTATPSTSPAATGSLPNTGLDTRLLLIGGAALLLCGLGLRLRSAPERF
jgi:LPXTG-motif cell wall-anchored protein